MSILLLVQTQKFKKGKGGNIYIYTMEYYSATKKNEIMPFAATWMDIECHTEWNKSDKEGEILYDIPYMGNLKRNYTNKLTKQRPIDLENELMVARGKG